MNEQEQKLQAEIDEIKKDIEAIILAQYRAYQRMDEVIAILGKLVGNSSEGGEEDC